MNKALKAGAAVTWKKLDTEARRADWTGIVLKVDNNAVVVEWTRVGDTSGKTKVQVHRNAEADRVLPVVESKPEAPKA